MKLALAIGIAFFGQLSPVDRDAALQYARGSLVSGFDAVLPNVSVDRWLSSLASTGAEIDWSLNDCGEQTGDPEAGRERDIPMCAEARVALEDGREVSVSLNVGTWQGGLSERGPGFWGAYLKKGDGTLRPFSTLTDLVSAVQNP